MIEIGRREKSQPPPRWVVLEALTQPDRDPARPWLAINLLHDEQLPQVLHSEADHLVVWSSLWLRRPDAQVRFGLASQGEAGGTALCWTLLVEPPVPDPPLVGHLCKRVNHLINAELRYTFGQ